jgi:hypothetical protein
MNSLFFKIRTLQLTYENGKIRPVETIPGMGRRIKENV